MCGRYSENEKEETGEILVEFAYIRGQKSLWISLSLSELCLDQGIISSYATG